MEILHPNISYHHANSYWTSAIFTNSMVKCLKKIKKLKKLK